jgi:hypothetical protein
VAVISLFFTLPAQAVTFTFTKIADNSGPFSFINGPSINDAGTVAFVAGLDAGGQGIFTGNGTTTTTIADSSGSFSNFFSGTSINNSGTVAFTAILDTLDTRDIPEVGVFTSNGTTTTTIATAEYIPGPINQVNYFSNPSINNAGTVAYSAEGFRFIQNRTSDGRFLDEGDFRVSFIGPPSINNVGTVAFVRSLGRFDFEIRTNNGTTTTTIARAIEPYAGGTGTFSRFGNALSINDAGTVAFEASLTAGGSGIFTINGTTTTTITDSSGPFIDFSDFTEVAINNAGTVAFAANLDEGGGGIFIGPNPLTDKVISIGDRLSGSTVEQLGFDEEGLNNVGQVAFFARLTDGTSGIFRAEPVPVIEPTPVPDSNSALGILVAVPLGLIMMRKKQQGVVNSSK